MGTSPLLLVDSPVVLFYMSAVRFLALPGFLVAHVVNTGTGLDSAF